MPFPHDWGRFAALSANLVRAYGARMAEETVEPTLDPSRFASSAFE
jgi:hypothetical protein